MYREHLLPSTRSDNLELLDAKLIGQERNGGVLFSWNSPGEGEAEEEGGGGGEGKGEGATFVGWHLLNTNTFMTLYK